MDKIHVLLLVDFHHSC